MNEKMQTWSMARPNPISRMMCKDDLLIPAHVREAMATPPKGYLNAPRDKHREPDAANVFTTRIPACRADVDLYLANLQYPHTRKERLLRRVATMPLPSLGATYAMFVAMGLSILAYFAFEDYEQRTAASISLYAVTVFFSALAISVACVLASYCADNHLDKHRNIYARNAPTALMRDITERSIDVSQIDSRLAGLAWDVYCYDTEHYDELVALLRDMRDNPAERGTKTHRVYNEIIDAFRHASELRQDVTRKTLADNAEAIEQRRRDAAARSANGKKLADEMRADILEATVLERLRAEASAAEDIYGGNK